ncbi:TIGR04219 family outer membrane beta-barrel protein [Aestuariibacter sp. AA17]|uniref:TIGR04219 family outer membrane beta-barrel protein n=1 Tax=Fluctibacter corallii TaxID=2984329 RepID=A0ABT3AD92_9ALTE|nr:TIGR04219 family outer membrane beta-barrel protein [Aestuariibacter sp. AA17]MCV2886638.1 TIGR04219 family outer membrane beta-barrel protein [Aestuariibacter sp. AA17]
MKKSLLLTALVGSLSANVVMADTIFGLYAGAQAWNMDTEGGFANSSTLTNFNFDKETKSTFYVAVEHPIPFIPNIKVARTDMDTGGSTVLQNSFTFDGQLFTSQTNVNTDIALSSTDFILYYELFDNDLISFDLGVNGKYIDGDLFVVDATDSSNAARERFSGVVPMLYSRFAVGMPLTGFGFFAEGNFLSIDDHTLTDYQAAVTYDVLDNPAVDLDLQLGYRVMKLELEDLDDIYSDIEFKGFYAGVEVHF